MVIDYLFNNWVEITGTILSLIYLYLSIHQKAGLWLFGLLSSVLYIVVFFQSKFYADMTLQFYYVAISVYGWIRWTVGKENSGKDLPVERIDRKMAFIVLLFFLIIFAAYYFVLKHLTDSPVPVGDSFTTALCVVATWMLARKQLENWLLFILADGILVGLFVYKHLYITAVLYLIYTVMAVVGYLQWRRSMQDADKRFNNSAL